MTWTEKILDLSVVTDKKLIAAEGVAHFWWDKARTFMFYYIHRYVLSNNISCISLTVK